MEPNAAIGRQNQIVFRETVVGWERVVMSGVRVIVTNKEFEVNRTDGTRTILTLSVPHIEDMVSDIFTCSSCKETFTSQSSLKGHMGIHAGQFRCKVPQCGITYRSKRSLSQHLVKHSRIEMDFLDDEPNQKDNKINQTLNADAPQLPISGGEHYDDVDAVEMDIADVQEMNISGPRLVADIKIPRSTDGSKLEADQRLMVKFSTNDLEGASSEAPAEVTTNTGPIMTAEPQQNQMVLTTRTLDNFVSTTAAIHGQESEIEDLQINQDQGDSSILDYSKFNFEDLDMDLFSR